MLEAGGAVALPDIAAAAADSAAGIGADESEAAPPEKKPHKFWIGVISGATLIGSAWNSFGDGANQKFHFTNEGWLGQNTYAGGGDKASHVVSYYIVAKLLSGRVHGARHEEGRRAPFSARAFRSWPAS